jgi:hypothetical protein
MMVLYMAWLLFGLVMCVYGLMFGINNGHSDRLLVVALFGVVTLMCALQFYSMCSKADCIMSAVSCEFRVLEGGAFSDCDPPGSEAV